MYVWILLWVGRKSDENGAMKKNNSRVSGSRYWEILLITIMFLWPTYHLHWDISIPIDHKNILNAYKTIFSSLQSLNYVPWPYLSWGSFEIEENWSWFKNNRFYHIIHPNTSSLLRTTWLPIYIRLVLLPVED